MSWLKKSFALGWCPSDVQFCVLLCWRPIPEQHACQESIPPFSYGPSPDVSFWHTFSKWLWSVSFTKHTKGLLSDGPLIPWPWTCPPVCPSNPAQKNIGTPMTFSSGSHLFLSGMLKSVQVDCREVLTQKNHTFGGNSHMTDMWLLWINGSYFMLFPIL